MIKTQALTGLGNIFWDLPTWIYYTANYKLGCTIYVANNTDNDRSYSLITHTYNNRGVLQSEGVLTVYGYTWFPVSSGDLLKLYGSIVLNSSDVVLTVDLVDQETQQAADSVSTILVTPTAAALPPGWGGGTIASIDWLSMMMMVMMMVMMVKIMSSATETEEEKRKRLEEQRR